MKNNKTSTAKLLIGLLCMLALNPALSLAQTTEELHAGYEQYWKEDLAHLKNISTEKNDHQAALKVAKMKEDMLPKLQKQLEATERWKRTHTANEVETEKKWAANNPLQKEVAELQSNLLISSSSRGGELAAAFGDYMHSMMQTIRRAK